MYTTIVPNAQTSRLYARPIFGAFELRVFVYESTRILRYDDSLSAIVCYFTRISIVRNKKTTIVTITFNYFY